MKLLLDTSVLVDILRGHRAALEFFADAADREDDLLSVSIVRTEVFAGMLPREESRTRVLLQRIDWIDVTVELADVAGDLARSWTRSHSGIGVVDFVLAAAAESAGAVVCTSNVRDFPMFPGLIPPYR